MQHVIFEGGQIDDVAATITCVRRLSLLNERGKLRPGIFAQYQHALHAGLEQRNDNRLSLAEDARLVIRLLHSSGRLSQRRIEEPDRIDPRQRKRTIAAERQRYAGIRNIRKAGWWIDIANHEPRRRYQRKIRRTAGGRS